MNKYGDNSSDKTKYLYEEMKNFLDKDSREFSLLFIEFGERL